MDDVFSFCLCHKIDVQITTELSGLTSLSILMSTLYLTNPCELIMISNNKGLFNISNERVTWLGWSMVKYTT